MPAADLPDFTNGLAPETALTLLRDEEFIVGIKDSSGREENVTTFAQARRDRDWTLLVGDDRLLSAGLLAGWDGGISGVAGCCPELLVAIVRSVRDQRPEETARLQAGLDELITRLSVFPTPWVSGSLWRHAGSRQAPCRFRSPLCDDNRFRNSKRGFACG